MNLGARAQVSKDEFVKAQKMLEAAHKAAAKEALQASYFGSGLLKQRMRSRMRSLILINRVI